MDDDEFMQIVNDQFTAMDVNGDGKLSKEEVHRFEKDIAPSIGKTYSFAETEQKFTNMDTDQSGYIDRAEWVAYCRKEAGLDEDDQ